MPQPNENSIGQWKVYNRTNQGFRFRMIAAAGSARYAVDRTASNTVFQVRIEKSSFKLFLFVRNGYGTVKAGAPLSALQ
jgi:hypothetical protein